MMKKDMYVLTIACGVTAATSASALGGDPGAISTDRFGYTGTVYRYDTLANAQTHNGVTGLVETIAVGNRDLSLFIVNGFPQYYSDANVIMGAWWYTTEPNTNGFPKDHPSGDRYYTGWGNTRGNTGIGFLQIYDIDGTTESSVSMAFSNFNGTHWTDFSLNISGVNANASDFARFSPFTSNVNDSGVYHTYSLSLTATGLEGQQTTPWKIEAFNHPTGVTGTYTGLFENTTASVNAGFYVFELDLDMENWAFAQGNAALNGDFFDSYFATIPAPGSAIFLAIAGLTARRRRM